MKVNFFVAAVGDSLKDWLGLEASYLRETYTNRRKSIFKSIFIAERIEELLGQMSPENMYGLVSFFLVTLVRF